MRVRVLFFGMLKELVGQRTDLLDLPPGSTVSHVLEHYSRVPRLVDLLPSVAISVNQEYAKANLILHDEDEIALLPPVSGGALEHPAAPDIPAVQVRLVHEPIDREQVIVAIKQPADGAVVVFDGIVRNHSRGRRTLFLEYEAYEPMALKELGRLATEARKQFAVREVVVEHRLGRTERLARLVC